MLTRKLIKEESKELLKKNMFVLVFIIALLPFAIGMLFAIAGGIIVLSGNVGAMLILMFAIIMFAFFSSYALNVAVVEINKVKDKIRLGDVFSAMTIGGYFKYCSVGIIQILLTAVLAIFFIVPGIIFAFKSTLVKYIVIEHPELSIREIFALSSTKMKGHKNEYLVLQVSFILWMLLLLIPFIGIILQILVSAYIEMTNYIFYSRCTNCDDGTYRENAIATKREIILCYIFIVAFLIIAPIARTMWLIEKYRDITTFLPL